VIRVRTRTRVAAVAVLVACFGMVALAAAPAGGGGGPATSTPPTSPSPALAAGPAVFTIPAAPPGPRWLIGMVSQPLATAAGAVSPRTRLGGQTWLLIVRHHGRYGMALVPTAGAPRLARVDLTKLQLRWTRMRVDIDLSQLRLSVLRGRRLLGEFPIAAGMPATPTPTGLFSVTDRVAFGQAGTYGTFALGLSAHQSHLQAGWTGGDQVAIHGTESPSSIGTYASLGCVRVGEAALRILRRTVPLGAPVTVHA
jgi:lipoprotein-anchoring transpeptidase ErfK/SrfK